MLMPFLIFVAIVLQQQHFRRVIAGAFVLALNPLVFLNDLRDFFTLVMSRLFGSTGGGATETAEIALIFPERSGQSLQARIDLVATLESMTGHAGIGVIGLIGFILGAGAPFTGDDLSAVCHHGSAVGYRRAPLCVLCGTVYLVRFWLVDDDRLTSRAFYKGWDGKIPPLARTLTSLGFGAVLLIGTAGWLDRGYVPRATFDKGVQKPLRMSAGWLVRRRDHRHLVGLWLLRPFSQWRHGDAA